MAQAGLDFSDFIADRTRDFTGREWVFAEIDHWLTDPDAPRYFIITGEPGIGKTAIAACLTQIRDLAAIHFCIARQAGTIDPLNFVRSFSHQLTYLDGFAQRIVEEQGVHVAMYVNVHQNYGQVIGAQIENLIGESGSALKAFNRTVLAPLMQLYADGLDQQLVILVDALDEAVQQPEPETIVDLLANARGLPPQVRFVLTSRPDSVALRHFENLHAIHLALDARREKNSGDIQEYIRRQLEASTTLQTRLEEQNIKHQAFIEWVTTASKGNFLYLVWLLPAIADGTQRFDALEVLPKGLDGIYREFLRTRTVGKDIDHWRNRYRPVLGMLVAAQAPLTAEQLADFTGLSNQEVDDILLDVRQFLDLNQALHGQYRLYHQSITDFLGRRELAGEFWVDLKLAHRQIVSHYQSERNDWREVDWSEVDDYGLLYLKSHLYALREVGFYRQLLYGLICTSLMWEKQARFGSHYPFAADVALTVDVASSEEPINWVQLVRSSLLYATLGSLATNIETRTLGVLAELGQVTRALDFAVLMSNADKQCQAYLLIGEALLARKDLERACAILRRALTVAETVEFESYRASFLNQLSQAFARLGDKVALGQALELSKRIRDHKARASALNGVALALIQIGEKQQVADVANQALLAAKSIHNESSRVSALSEVAKTLAQAKDRVGLDEIVVTVEAIKDGWAKATGLSEVAQAFAQIGDTVGVHRVAAALQAIKTAKANVWALSGIARAFIQIGDGENAANIANQILRAVRSIGYGGERPSALLEVIQVLAQQGECDQALVMTQTIGAKWARASAFRTVASTLAEVGQNERANEVINQALTETQAIADVSHRTWELCRLAEMLIQVGEKERAVSIANHALETAEAVETRRRTESLSRVAEFLARIGEKEKATYAVDQALAAAEMLWCEPSRADALIEIAQALVNVGQTERAARALDQTITALETMAPEPKKAAVVTRVSQVLAQIRGKDGLKRVFQVAETIENEQAKAQALGGIAQAIAQICDRRGLNQILLAVQAISDQSARSQALSRVASAFVQIGVRTKYVANQAYTAADSIEDSLDKALALTQAAKALAQVGAFNEALAAVEAIGDEGGKAVALSQLAQVLALEGDFDRAMSVVDAIRYEVIKVSPLSEIALTLAQAGQTQKARETMTLALKVAKAFSFESSEMAFANRLEDVIALAMLVGDPLCRMANALSQVGEKDQAAETVNQVLTAAKMIGIDRTKGWLLGRVAQTLAQTGDKASLDRTLLLAETIRNKKDKALALGKVAQALEQAGHQAEAERTLRIALATAQFSGRESMFEVLQCGVTTLAAIDQGKTLWSAYEVMLEIDGWWGRIDYLLNSDHQTGSADLKQNTIVRRQSWRPDARNPN